VAPAYTPSTGWSPGASNSWEPIGVIAVRIGRTVFMRRLVAAATLIIAGALAAGLAVPVVANTAPAAASAARAPTAGFSAVSCPRTTFCLAVGRYTDRAGRKHSLAEQWNGSRWRVLSNPPGQGLTGLSCPSTRFCMATNGPTTTLTWNGKTWRKTANPAGAAGMVSCGSSTLCMVIDERVNGGVAESWNGRTWRIWRDATDACGGPPGFPCGLASVACGSATNCLAVGTETISQEPMQIAIGFRWNGRQWDFSSPPSEGDPAASNAVSCTARFCMALGGYFSEVQNGGLGDAAALNVSTKTWTDVPPNLGVLCQGFGYCFWAQSVSCGSATSCMSFGGHVMAWDGTAWKPAPAISAGRNSGLRDYSCAGAPCLAAGYRTVSGVRHPLAELWNGTRWRILAVPMPG
jgi:hypothetical protein